MSFLGSCQKGRRDSHGQEVDGKCQRNCQVLRMPNPKIGPLYHWVLRVNSDKQKWSSYVKSFKIYRSLGQKFSISTFRGPGFPQMTSCCQKCVRHVYSGSAKKSTNRRSQTWVGIRWPNSYETGEKKIWLGKFHPICAPQSHEMRDYLNLMDRGIGVDAFTISVYKYRWVYILNRNKARLTHVLRTPCVLLP